MIINYFENLDITGFEKVLVWNTKYSIIKSANIRMTSMGWWVAVVRLANNPIGYIQQYSLNASAGSSIYAKQAIVSALGEAIERYSSTNYHAMDKVYMQHFDNRLFEFVRCAQHEDAPKRFKEHSTSVAIEHSEVINVMTGEKNYIPFEFVHLGFRRKEGLVTQPISTGCAFYPRKIESIWKGICEVVERDAMMKFWYTYFKKFFKIDINDIYDFEIQIRVKSLAEKSTELFLFEITSEVNIPVVLCVLKNEAYPYYVTGVACDLDIKRASVKAIDEAVSIRTMAEWKGPQDRKEFCEINQLEDHMFLYANWKNCPIFEELLNKEAPFSSLNLIPHDYPRTEKELKQKISTFFDEGVQIFYKDLTLPHIEDIGYVTRIVIPKMIPLSQTYKARWLDALNSELLLNPYPQPFS